MKKLFLFLVVAIFMLQLHVHAQTKSRGVVAVPADEGSIFISWRLFSSDPEDVSFNVYRSNASEENVLVNDSPITDGTNFIDNSADLSKSNTYRVEAISSGESLLKSASASSDDEVVGATAAVPSEPNITIPLRDGAEIHFAWVGDLNGDGNYDYVIDRLDWGNGCYLEAYTHDGTFLWDIDYGPNSSNMDNISPGSATIDVGHWDGVTVADLNGDGQAEVITKVADGVRLGNGFVWDGGNSNNQWLVVLDGATGGWMADARIPDDYISTGPVSCQLGVGNGNEVFMHAKNRNSNGSFNAIDACYTFSGGNLSLKWKHTGGFPQGHQIRVVDVNADGVDDLAHIGFVRDGNTGNMLYSLPNITHGDRWHIGKFDPDRPGLQGYGVQQNSPNNIIEYYYDASNGQILWTHPGGYDNGRGNAADIDPRYDGYEVWSFEGIYNGPTNTQITQEPDRPWPNLRIWWDGDNGSELFDNGDIEAWNYEQNWTETLLDCGDYGATGSYRGAPLFYGDFLGDWREEVIMRNSSNNQLIIFTTTIPTNISRPSLMEDRYYRNDLTVKGYMQSHHTSYYIGEGGSSEPPSNNGQFNGTYSIIASHSGKAMDTYNWGTTNGTNIVQWNYWGGEAQQYNISQVDGDWHRISPVIATDQGFDIASVSTADGANLQTYSYWGGDNQQFRFESTGANTWQIIARHSGKCLDVEGASTEDGANIIQWSCINGASNQMFELISSNSARAEPENDLTTVFEVFPIPAENTLNLSISTKLYHEVEVSIINQVGQQILQVNQVSKGMNSIDISSLEAGMYFVKVKYGQERMMKKFTKK